ncbi:hypothetical protein, partial [Acinetobacter baumannii]|uniref:hypothetical protein n=1 Tax=Acinetobacter baumannii TaxID=470 RepID=UPI001BB46F48
TTYPSYALNLAQLGALCISNLCATKPLKSNIPKCCGRGCVRDVARRGEIQAKKMVHKACIKIRFRLA